MPPDLRFPLRWMRGAHGLSLPPFRRLEPADPERPLSASAEELTKDWIVRLIEHTPLDQIRELPTDRIARELPPLIEEVLRAVLAAGRGAGRRARKRAAPAVEELAVVPRRRRADPGAAADVAALETVLLGAVKERLADDPDALVDGGRAARQAVRADPVGTASRSSCASARASSSGSPTRTR